MLNDHENGHQGGVLKSVTPAITAAVLMASVGLASGQEAHGGSGAITRYETIASIERYARQVERDANRDAMPQRVLGNICTPVGESCGVVGWIEFRDERELHAAVMKASAAEWAIVWLSAGKITLVHYSQAFEEGDFVLGAYYFRKDGTLAKLKSQLSRFESDTTVKRESYYDRSGWLLGATTRYFDLLATVERMKPGTDFQYAAVPVFLTTGHLPFLRFLDRD